MPTQVSRSYSLKTIHGGVYTRNRRFIKPDSTVTVTPFPKPISELPNPPRLSRSQTDSFSLNKNIINSRNGLESFIYL